MDHTKSGGLAWIVGSLLLLVTMSLHPTGRDLATSAAFEHGAFLARATHALALLALPLFLHGGWTLARSLASGTSQLALCTFGLGLGAVMLAALASGLVAPELFGARLASEGATRDGFDLLLHYNFELNQACARVYVVASALALGLWSLEGWRLRALARGLSVFGLLLAVTTALGVLSGHLRLDVHGFGAVALGQAAWMIAVGVALVRRAPSAATAGPR